VGGAGNDQALADAGEAIRRGVNCHDEVGRNGEQPCTLKKLTLPGGGRGSG
jgi:hypothetical protein